MSPISFDLKAKEIGDVCTQATLGLSSLDPRCRRFLQPHQFFCANQKRLEKRVLAVIYKTNYCLY